MKKTAITMGLALMAATLVSPMVGTAKGQTLLVNGDFESGNWNYGGAPPGWVAEDYNALNYPPNTDPAYVFAGAQSFGGGPQAFNNTYPAISQTFSLAAGVTEMTISGYVKTGPGGIGSIRLRENLLGGAGIVRYYDVASSSWALNDGPIVLPTAFYNQNDAFGLLNDGSALYESESVFLNFAFTVPVLSGVSTYTLDLGSVNFVGTGSAPAIPGNSAYWDNVSVTAVPEPSVLLLFGLGFGMLLLMQRRKRMV